jgi:hypothetical protein
LNAEKKSFDEMELLRLFEKLFSLLLLHSIDIIISVRWEESERQQKKDSVEKLCVKKVVGK